MLATRCAQALCPLFIHPRAPNLISLRSAGTRSVAIPSRAGGNPNRKATGSICQRLLTKRTISVSFSGREDTLVPKDDDLAQLAQEDRQSLASEFRDFLKHNKKWWLLPILVVILGLGLLVFLSGSGAAPFIYTLF